MAKNNTIGDYGSLLGDGFALPPKPTLGKDNSSVPGNISTPNNTGKHSNPTTPKKSSTLIAKTYKLPADMVRKIEAIAYWRRERIQVVMSAALEAYIAQADASELVLPSR